MKCIPKCAFLLLLSAVPVVESRTGSPVEKVVNLLKALQDRIEQDGENEEKIYNKYACWCDISMKKKADAIDQARIDLRALSQEILKLKGEIATLTSEIEELAGKIAENEKLQADATALRQKENAEFMAATTEMKQALAAMQDAITVLIAGSAPDAEASSLLQRARGQAAVSAQASAMAVRKAFDALPSSANLSEKSMSLLSEFMQGHSSTKYAPQSLTIQGILKDLYNTFSTDLEESTLKEATQNRDYELFIKTKQEEKAAMEMAKKLREEQKADAEMKLADATALYDETDATKAADEEFFDATKASCLDKKEEFDLRVSARTEELDGVKKALEILTSDESRELFASAIKVGKEVGADGAKYETGAVALSFAQLDGSDTSAPRARAYEVLRQQATKAHSIRLAQLAAQVHEAKVGHFDAVIKAIDAMLATLMEENEADISKRDQCKAEYQDADKTAAQLKWEIEKNEAKINKLEAIIAEHEAEKAKTIQAIADTQEQIAMMTKEREESNAAFLAAKDEDLKAIDLLHQAKVALTEFYKAHGIEMGKIEAGVKEMTLLQKSRAAPEVPVGEAGPDFEVSQWQAPEAKFSGKGARAGETKDIVSIMTMLIEDLNDEISNSMKSEEEAQLAYEKAKAAAEKLIEDLTAKKVSLEEMIAQRTVEKAEENAKKTTNEALLKDELDYRAKITPDCDWIIGAFYKRAARRDAEEKGLQQAKDYLAGANEAAFVQKGRGANSDLASIKFLNVQQ